jgi:thymidylate kinase
MTTVAIIGADGAGKSTVCRKLLEDSSLPLRYVYMGVNLEASRRMLPTTRLVLWLKQRRGRRPDAVFRSAASKGSEKTSFAGNLKALLRFAFWASEEWYRQLIVWTHEIRGETVVFDRHFYADYYAYDVAPADDSPRTLASRLHGFMLGRLYPKPDLFILLEAPPEELFRRKPEASVEYLRDRQEQYVRMGRTLRAFRTVDATQPLDEVVAEVESLITSHICNR